jgi:hypothetical protein
MRLRRLAVALTLLAAFASDSWGQSKDAPKRNEPQAQSKDIQKHPPADQRGTDNSPLVVRVLTPPQDRTEAAQPSKANDEKPPTDWYMFGVTVVLAFIAVLQLIAFIVQARRLGQTIDVMKDTAQRQLRAYVFLDGIDLRRFNDAVPNISPWRFRIAWKNTGSTRARRFVSKVSHALIDLTNQPLERFAFQDERDAKIFRGLIGSNQSVNPPPIPVLDLHLHSAGDDETALLIWGWAEYQDIFDETVHRTEFGFRVVIEGNILNNHLIRFEPTEKHNAADEDCMKPVRRPVSANVGANDCLCQVRVHRPRRHRSIPNKISRLPSFEAAYIRLTQEDRRIFTKRNVWHSVSARNRFLRPGILSYPRSQTTTGTSDGRIPSTGRSLRRFRQR